MKQPQHRAAWIRRCENPKFGRELCGEIRESNMKTKMRKLAGRIALIATLCLLAITLLASCGGGNKVTLPLKQNLPAAVAENKLQLKDPLPALVTEGEQVNGMTAEELAAVAKMLSASYSEQFNPIEKLAALKDNENRLEESKKVLVEANERAKADDRCDKTLIETKLTLVDADYLIDSLYVVPKNGLTTEQLLKIAEMMQSVYAADFDPREMLVAAWRGYDMTAEGFSDAIFPGEGPLPALEDEAARIAAAKNVIRAANARAKAENQIGNEFETNLNLVDVQYLINAFKMSVDMSSGGGFFDTILSGIGVALRWMTNTLTFKSYLAGICLFAVIIEILMLPFAIKQQKNSIRQAKLRPKEMAIRNKYKGRTDQVTMQKMNQEIQEFYQRENFSPYSGCLPLLIQLPIIIALYNIVIDPLHYVMGQASGVSAALDAYYSASRAAGGLGGALGGNGTIAVLSDISLDKIAGLQNFAYFDNGADVYNSLAGVFDKIPNFNIGSINFGLTPSLSAFNILLLVPILTFAVYFLTSKLNRKLMYQPTANAGADARQVACSNGIMDITMPLMSTVFTFMVPAVVGIYWIFRSLVGLLKQFIISRAMPMPVFTEEDYKQAAREMAGKRVVKKSENAGKVRSLHHIDDEDFEDTRERALARKAAIEEREKTEQEERRENATFAELPMKEDRKKERKKKKSPAVETDEALTEVQETESSDDSQNTNQE